MRRECSPQTRQFSLQYENQSSGARSLVLYSAEMLVRNPDLSQRWRLLRRQTAGLAVRTKPRARRRDLTTTDRGRPVPGMATLRKLSTMSSRYDPFL